jgi:hypothetical protein
MSIGTVFKVKRAVLNNDPGALGICYEEYEIGGRPGLSIIFENGEHDGFSPDEQKLILEKVGHLDNFHYEFKSVIRLVEDFRRGFFREHFDKAKASFK